LAEPGLMQGDTNTGVSTFAFGGDLLGNLWKFDLSTSISPGISVFVAKDAGGAPQPITSLTSLAYDSATNSTFALFGTGKYLSNADVSNTQTQTWYGLRVGTGADLMTTALATAPNVTNTTARSALTPRYAVDVGVNRATSLQVAGDMNNKAGWFMDLPQTGERIINRTQFIAGKAVVTTLIPKVSDPCNTIPAGALMGVDPFTGANQVSDYGLGTTTISYTNAAGQPVSAVVAINGQVFASGPAGGVTAVYTADGKVSITFNTLGGGQVNLGPLNLGGGSTGRVSWRELVN
ncbi:MAG: PilC/PilY family type IV pilus protein, partial [Halothiobacillus sp.]